ncbi:unnamed protein product, partial [Allacma fusca]
QPLCLLDVLRSGVRLSL